MTQVHQRDEPAEAAADVATPQEVLQTFTTLMRGSKPSEQMKAAETLAKHYGLLTPHEESAAPSPALTQAIAQALQELDPPPAHASDA